MVDNSKKDSINISDRDGGGDGDGGGGMVGMERNENCCFSK